MYILVINIYVFNLYYKMAKTVICDLVQIFKNSVSAVVPEKLVRKCIKYNPLTQQATISGLNYNLQNKNLYIIGTGKAVQNMAIEAENIFNSKIKEGIVSIPFGSLKQKTINNVLYLEGALNNLPDENAVTTAKKIKDLASKLTKDDLLLVFISGGASALLPLPKHPITLEEKTTLIKELANSGADITELNTIRKRISDLKGGQLAWLAYPAQVITLILSDIVGDPIDLIGSGPTVENNDDPVEVINILNKYNLYTKLPNSIKHILESKENKINFPKENVRNIFIGSNKMSVAAALAAAKLLNYYPLELSNTVTGNVRDIAKEYVNLVKIFCDFKTGSININELISKVDVLNIPGLKLNGYDDELIKNMDLCLILAGETTVKVTGNGIGGRNQQLALEFSKFINKYKGDINNGVYLLSAGTDGIDGPTDAAGAVGYLDLISDCDKTNVDANMHIENNDAYNFFKNFRNGELHIVTGHTNTNVMDIHLIIIKQKI